MKRPRPKKVIPIKENIQAESWKQIRKALKRSRSISNEVRKVAVVPADPSENIPVEGTDFDIRDLVHTSDSVEVRQGIKSNLLARVEIDLIPDVVNNPSFDIDYDASNRIDQIDMVLNGDTYRRTITYTAGGLIDTISAWDIQ